uniref:Uncharacterized protein n=1 Tax=Amphimedon queenslandica TaxID=400682 RepID=A0A1X7SEI4_AMPQE
MIGWWWVTSYGFGFFINTTVKFPFDCESHTYVLVSILYNKECTIILIVFVILAKCYKYCVKENEVNIVKIVDDHYQRYINQREQFCSDTDSDSSSD